MGLLYMFLAISTGLLPNEDSAGDAIIIIFVTNLSIVAGLLLKAILVKYYKLYKSWKDKRDNAMEEKEHLSNLKTLTKIFPDFLPGIKSYLY